MINRSIGNSKVSGVNSKVSGLLFFAALLLSACDGGIFGTGGPDSIEMNASSSADIPFTEGVDAENASDSQGTTETAGSGTDEAGNAATGGLNGADATDGSADAGATDSATTDGGFAPGNSDGEGTTEAGDTTSNLSPESPMVDTNRFTNNQASLIDTAPQINVINATSLSINVVETGVQAQPVLFGAGGIAMNTLSNRAALLESETSLDIVDNNTQTERIFSFTDFAANDSTFTTLLVRQNGEQIDAVPLITLTATQDVTLAKVRVIQAMAYNDASAQATVSLQSAGANPGGVDVIFGPLSFISPETSYIDIPKGDYELIDSLGRVQNQALNFSGGNVYTVVLLENNTGSLLVINDTEAATQ